MDEWDALAIRVGEVFTPSAPIDNKRLFAGRTRQLRKVVDAVNQRGQHAIIYGERGVGKTSLANVLAKSLSVPGGRLIVPHVNADSGDTYSSLWHKVMDEIVIYKRKEQTGFETSGERWLPRELADEIPEEITTGSIRRLLGPLGTNFVIAVIIDEFDRLPLGPGRTMMADTVKMLADHTVGITLVLVGVADSVDALIAEHQSLNRNLTQVLLPRMSDVELAEIIKNGIAVLGMTMEPGALSWITSLSKGLPHYTHLLGKFAARSAIDARNLNITMNDVATGIAEAIGEAQQTISNAYHEATSSPRRDAIHRQVLLACALAKTDEQGFFTPSAVLKQLNTVAKREKAYDYASFSSHLKEFCGPERGTILEKRGVHHRPRYRFNDAMLQPYVLLKAFSDHTLTLDAVSAAAR